MSDLLIHSRRPDPDGCVISVTPESAHWHYVGFDVYHWRKVSNSTGTPMRTNFAL